MKIPIFLLLSALTIGAAANNLDEKIKTILKMEHRTEAETNRDPNRDPLNAIKFFGISEDSKVMEFGPGAGWYTKILAPLLADKGRLYIAGNAQHLEWINSELQKASLKPAKELPFDIQWNPERFSFEVGKIDFKENDLDIVVSIREYHNFDAQAKSPVNKAIFAALKPGGHYIIIDHTRRHMQPESDEQRRREDPVNVILEVQSAGFVLDASSPLFFKPDDELRYEVGRKTVTGNTDRFMLRFRKP